MNNFRLVNYRLTGKDKGYHMAIFGVFADHMVTSDIGCAYVEIGKQDVRGGYSICLLTANHSCVTQRLFENKDQMIGFIIGYNQAIIGGL